jgi:hypothetical protein
MRSAEMLIEAEAYARNGNNAAAANALFVLEMFPMFSLLILDNL